MSFFCAEMAGLLLRLFGRELARSLEASYASGDSDALHSLFVRAGLRDIELRILPGAARFASAEAWVHTDIRRWTLADAIDDGQYERLLSEARRDLAHFAGEAGEVAFDAPAHIAAWRKGTGEGDGFRGKEWTSASSYLAVTEAPGTVDSHAAQSCPLCSYCAFLLL